MFDIESNIHIIFNIIKNPNYLPTAEVTRLLPV